MRNSNNKDNNKHSFSDFVGSDKDDKKLKTINTTPRLKFAETTHIPLYRQKYLDGLLPIGTSAQSLQRSGNSGTKSSDNAAIIRYVDEETIQSPFDQLGYFSELDTSVNNKSPRAFKEV